MRLIGAAEMAGSAPFIADDVAEPDLYDTFVTAPHWWETSIQEFSSRLDENHLAQVRQDGAITDIPLVVIGSDQLDAPGNGSMDALQAAPHETMRSLPGQSPNGEFVFDEGSSHNVLSDRPDLIVAAVGRIVGA